MRITGISFRLTALFGGLALAAGVLGAPAAQASGRSSTSGWQISTTIGSSSSEVGGGDLAVAGPDAAWTMWNCGPCPSGSAAHQNVLLAWNGKKWSPLGLPAELKAPHQITGMQASSASNLWVFTNSDQAAVFDGTHWARKVLPGWVERPIIGNEAAMASAVFSSSNVWAFSLDAHSEPTLAGHFDQGSWHKVQLPISPQAVFGLSASDIWIFGFAKGSGPRTLAHWDGNSWQTVALPKAPAGGTLIDADPVALGAKSVWLVGELFPKHGKVTYELQHWTGHWTSTAIPASVGNVAQLASDGHGGFWLLASDTIHAYFVHHTAGQWDHVAIPTMGKLASSIGALSPIKGSRSMWAIGSLIDSGAIPRFGAVLRFSP